MQNNNSGDSSSMLGENSQNMSSQNQAPPLPSVNSVGHDSAASTPALKNSASDDAAGPGAGNATNTGNGPNGLNTLSSAATSNTPPPIMTPRSSSTS